MSHDTFITTGRGLRRDILPMRLYEKAKQFGTWNPSDIDFARDRADWQRLAADEQDLLRRLTSMFQAGEEAVTLDLLPLVMTIAAEGRLEEELYLTTFLFEEAKHTDFFNRFLTEVAAVENSAELARYHGHNYRLIFYAALPTAMNRLRDDASPAAQVGAAATYNMVVEGVLAETGYHAYFTALAENDLMPGQRRGVQLLRQDESRHIAYGVFLLSRLMAQDPALWSVIEDTMNDLLIPALGVISDAFAAYDPMPFGLEEATFIDYASSQFQKRIDRIERARGASLDEIYRVAHLALENEDETAP